MIKKILFLLFILILFAKPVRAFENEVGSSGKLIALAEVKTDERAARLKAYLESKNSPCADFSDDFVYFADKYGLDWKLGPAIAGIESSFCQVYPVEYNNPFGIAGGYYHFNNLKDAIEYLNELIATNGYYTKFQQTRDIFDLAFVYCELSQKWVNAVSRFMTEIDSFAPSETTDLKVNL